MRSRHRARRLRRLVAAIVFTAMLGVRIEPVPDDDNDPIVDYGPQLSSSVAPPGSSDSTEDGAPTGNDQPVAAHVLTGGTSGTAEAMPYNSGGALTARCWIGPPAR